jgi:hypothetical protein
MKKHLLSCAAPLGFCLLFLAACATTQPRYCRPGDFIPALEQLSSALRAELQNPFVSAPRTGDQLLAAALKEKPELQAAFRRVTLLITNQQTQAIVILVSPTNANVAWFEDASWTPAVDKFHYQSNPPSPAKFTIPFR